jgi:hypothetical protein
VAREGGRERERERERERREREKRERKPQKRWGVRECFT